ncbi:MAG: hypothetical protein R3C44_21830 [Chloroflexota bacterium]
MSQSHLKAFILLIAATVTRHQGSQSGFLAAAAWSNHASATVEEPPTPEITPSIVPTATPTATATATANTNNNCRHRRQRSPLHLPRTATATATPTATPDPATIDQRDPDGGFHLDAAGDAGKRPGGYLLAGREGRNLMPSPRSVTAFRLSPTTWPGSISIITILAHTLTCSRPLISTMAHSSDSALPFVTVYMPGLHFVPVMPIP